MTKPIQFFSGPFAILLRLIATALMLTLAHVGEAKATCVTISSPSNSRFDPVDVTTLGGRQPLILIHGINIAGASAPPSCDAANNKDLWDDLISFYNSVDGISLRSAYKLYRFSYLSNNVSLVELGRQLRQAIDTASNADPTNFATKRVSIVAHSMGGLIARYFMHLPQQNNGPFNGMKGGERVTKLITLGTPHHGTPIANGPARNAWAVDHGKPGWGLFMGSLDDHFNLKYYDYNRQELRWDNYAGASISLNYNTYSEENVFLSVLNGDSNDRVYDAKIIAYAGKIQPVDIVGGAASCLPGGALCEFLGLAAKLLDSVFEFDDNTDGVVPRQSALFDGRLSSSQTRVFKGYNHFDLPKGVTVDSVVLWTGLFLQLRDDLRINPPPATSDLVPQNITLSSMTLSPGQSFTANWRLANVGTTAASATSTTVIRWNQSPTNAAGTNRASIQTEALPTGQFVQQTATLTAPTTPGTYYVWVIADNYSTVANQSDVSNDLQHSAVFTVIGASADLIPLPSSIIPSSGTVTAGATFTATWTLANNGTVAANSPSTTVVRINGSTQTAAPKNNLGGVSTPALSAGQSVVQTASLVAPSVPGTYYIWVIADNYSEVTNQVDAANDLQHSAAFTVVAPSNSLQVSPATNLSATGPQGGPFSQASIDYQLSTSAGTVSYSIAVTYADPGVQTWLGVTPSTSGTVGTSPTVVTVGLNSNAQSLSPGTYSATITFTNTGTGQNTQRTATLSVTTPPPGALQVSPGTGIQSSGPEYGPFSPVVFPYLLKSTSGPVNFEITNLPSWLTVDVVSGTATGTGFTVWFAINNAALLPPGPHTATINVTNTTNGQGSTTIPAMLTVNALPALQVSPATNFVASGNQGGPFSPASFQYQLSSSTGTLNFEITNIPPWLTPSATSGPLTTSPTTITFTVNATAYGLTPGTYNGSLTFTNTTNNRGNQYRLATLIANAAGTGPFFQGLGGLNATSFARSRVATVSADGKVVVGTSFDVSVSRDRAFRWSNGSMTALDFLPGYTTRTEAKAVSSDGSVIVGEAWEQVSGTPTQVQAVRWQNGAVAGLGFLPGTTASWARGVSADGSVVAGISSGGAAYGAFRWINGAMTGLGLLADDDFNRAPGVNSDGTIIVGAIRCGSAPCPVAARWVNGTLGTLGFLPGGDRSGARAVSSDGGTVVGFARDSNLRTQAFRWSNGNMIPLGLLPGGTSSFANAVNADGSVIVGYADPGPAFRWTATDGVQRIEDLLTAAGVNFAGWSLRDPSDILSAAGVSADGAVIVGNGIDPDNRRQGWIARLPLPAAGLQVSSTGNIVAAGSQGGPFSPSTFQYQLSAAAGSIDFSISGIPSWLNASLTSGTVTPAGTTITFSMNASANSLPPGTSSGTISFINTTSGQGNTTRTATLTVSPESGTLQLTPNTGMSAAGTQGGPFSPSLFSYTLSSTTGSVGYSISGLPTWLTASSTSGTATPAGTIITFTVNASANSLVVGTYDTTITFTNTTNGQGTQFRDAALTIATPPQTYTISMSASPSSGGTASGSGTFAAGSSRAVTAIANSGYTFTNWTEGGSVLSTSASYSFTLNGNRTLVANFATVPPTCGLSANPTTINQGQSSLLSWTSTDATSGSITNIGSVGSAGSQTVFPSQTTTYAGTFTGAGGNTNCQTTITVIVPPPNDNFADAITIQGGQTLTGTNAGATREGGEPNHAGNAGGGSLWWKFTAAANGQVKVSTANSSFDTLLAVHTGSAVNALTPVASNNDHGGALTSFVAFNVVAGATYSIAVDGFNGASGNISLSMSAPNAQLTCGMQAQLADFNGDGKTDILTRHTDGGIGLYLMNGFQSTANQIVATVDPQWKIVGAGDFNGDGKADFLMRHTDGRLAIYLMNGFQVLGSQVIGAVGNDWVVVGVGDFNGDGKADFMTRRSTDGSFAIYLMNGFQNIDAQIIGSASLQWSVVGVGDFNGDHKADFVVRHTDGSFAIYLMNGFQILASEVAAIIGNEWTFSGVADFDANGKSDFVNRRTDGSFAIFLMNGTQFASATIIGAVGNEWALLGVGDFNGDGKADFINRRTTDASVAIFLMNVLEFSDAQIIVLPGC